MDQDNFAMFGDFDRMHQAQAASFGAILEFGVTIAEGQNRFNSILSDWENLPTPPDRGYKVVEDLLADYGAKVTDAERNDDYELADELDDRKMVAHYLARMINLMDIEEVDAVTLEATSARHEIEYEIQNDEYLVDADRVALSGLLSRTSISAPFNPSSANDVIGVLTNQFERELLNATYKRAQDYLVQAMAAYTITDEFDLMSSISTISGLVAAHALDNKPLDEEAAEDLATTFLNGNSSGVNIPKSDLVRIILEIPQMN